MAERLLPPEDAWDLVAGVLDPLPECRLPLVETLGSWLAEPIRADRDIPPAHRAAMDGYAVRSSDIVDPSARFEVLGEVAAGSSTDPCFGAGECIRIFTGANLPSTADTVVPVEATSVGSFDRDGLTSSMAIIHSVPPLANVFRQGETARSGDVLVPRGARIGPRQIAVAAAVGRVEVLVHRKPKVAVLNTGEELLEAGQSAGRHQTRNSNGPFLMAALGAAGMQAASPRVVPDSLQDTAACLMEAMTEADVVVVTGGISAGRHDHVPAAIARSGGEIAYRGVAIKPGMPQLFARTARGSLLFGLPGNPLSCLVGFYEFVLPALRRLAGCSLGECRPILLLPLAAEARNTGDRTLILPALLVRDEERTRVLPRPPVGSADLVTGGVVDGALLLPPRCGTLEPGAMVRFRPWTEGWS